MRDNVTYWDVCALVTEFTPTLLQ